jgi:S-adenosylmethionine uptake transporter
MWALLMNLTSSINDVLARFLGDRLHFVEIAFFRFLFSTIVILIPMLCPVIARIEGRRHVAQAQSCTGLNGHIVAQDEQRIDDPSDFRGLGICARQGISLFKSQYHKEHLWRGVLGSIAIGLCCLSVNTMPLAENTTILFADTLFMLPLAAIFLHERIGGKCLAATLIGTTGLIIMYRPSTSNINLSALAPTFAAFLFAIMNIIIKKMVDNKENNLTMLFYFGLYTSLISSIFVPFYWVMPNIHEILLLLLLGICSNLIQLFLFLAFRATLATYITPLRYTELPFSVLFGYIFFAQIPDATMILGAALIIIGTFIASTFSTDIRS